MALVSHMFIKIAMLKLSKRHSLQHALVSCVDFCFTFVSHDVSKYDVGK
jgi:hypothetical protein